MCVGLGAAAFVAVAATVISTGVSVYAATRPTPTMPTPKLPAPAAPMTVPKPPEAAPTGDVDMADAKARQAATRKQRDLESRRSNASTILTTPLGVTTPSGNVQSTVLGR